MKFERKSGDLIAFRAQKPGRSGRGGFTLLELTAVVAIITILVSLLCAALNQTKARALRLTCLDNMRQLQFAWQLYIGDNQEAMPLNRTAPAPSGPRFIARGSSTNSWVAGNPLADLTTDKIRQGTLYPYVRSDSIYRCPMDDSTVTGHADTLRTRSYSMSAFLGGDPDLRPAPKVLATELARPQNVFVFIEEHPLSVWQSSFLVIPMRPGQISAANAAASWLSTPSDRHNQGCNISFADGHIEYWRWYTPKTPSDGTQLSSTPLDMNDIRRLAACTPTE
jgi:prepilin-type processing-associated H-X9-DG protein/prepilin-type N-terminal cleavage/methylation domain-containing protein